MTLSTMLSRLRRPLRPAAATAESVDVDRPVVRVLRAALAWLVAGVTLGVVMAVHPPVLAWRAAHIHMLLLGFVTGMIFGVGYHVFPRFAGRPLRHPRLAMPHWYLANGGVAAMAAAFILRAEGMSWSPALLGMGGAAATCPGVAVDSAMMPAVLPPVAA